MDKKFRHRDWLKTGSSQSLTDVGERQVYIELLYIDGSNNQDLRNDAIYSALRIWRSPTV